MKILRLPDLKAIKGIPFCDVHLHRLEDEGKFPKRVKLSPGGFVGWLEHEIDAWIESKAAARPTTPSGKYGTPSQAQAG